jgi:hypothetical protein
MLRRCAAICAQGLKTRLLSGKALRMGEDPRKNMSRDERLAAKLRENLRRRKAQSRQISRAPGDSDAGDATESLPNPPRES